MKKAFVIISDIVLISTFYKIMYSIKLHYISLRVYAPMAKFSETELQVILTACRAVCFPLPSKLVPRQSAKYTVKLKICKKKPNSLAMVRQKIGLDRLCRRFGLH